MGIEYYGFAFFVTAMICIIAILFRLLFSDVRRQKKMLDEKETQLLDLYRTVENMMEEFADHVKAVTKDMQEHEDKMAKLAATPPPPPIPMPMPMPIPGQPTQAQSMTVSEVPETMEKLPRSMTVDASAERIKAAGEVIERAGRVIQGDLARLNINGYGDNMPTFRSFYDESANEIQVLDPPQDEKQIRNDTILNLASQGKTTAQIAQELGITQNEVKLIIKLREES